MLFYSFLSKIPGCENGSQPGICFYYLLHSKTKALAATSEFS
jgi:hypothetical protein